MADRPISLDDLRVLADHVRGAAAITATACAHLTAMLVAPAGSFVTVAPISGKMRVCVGRKPVTGHDDVWVDWPAWQERWAIGPLDAAFALIEAGLPGANFVYGRGRTRAEEPPYGCQILFGWDEVLGEAEHEDGPSAVVLALLAALLARTTPANVDSLPEQPRSCVLTP